MSGNQIQCTPRDREMRSGSEIKGLVLEIQRMSTEDGPGIRTTVFTKGCPLNCAWCHNPESISSRPQVFWHSTACLGCGTCEAACPEGAVSISENGVTIKRQLCTGCGACAEACPSASIELLGKEWTAADLAAELARDRAFYEKSGGGVTVSGGESTLQREFTAALLKELRGLGISTALDTCGLFHKSAIDEIFPFANLILYDLKESDPELHRNFTGVSNEIIIENLRLAAAVAKNSVYPEGIWIRTPVIPGMTARKDNMTAIGKIISGLPAGVVKRWDLCAFNNLCADKYTRLGMDWRCASTPLVSKELMDELYSAACDSGADPAIISWSGSVK